MNHSVKIKILVLFLLAFFSPAKAQQFFQNIRGTVVDKVSQSPVPGAVVQLLNTDPAVAVLTDEKGHFILEKVPAGKQSLKISYMGYKEVLLQNLTVNTGKELVLNIGMEEDATLMEEVEVSAKQDKNKALNEMSTVSTRAFSVEETQKFAAAVNDPARMATSFAGVVGGNDGNNHISIRGNSPNGLLWRMEGVEIPNPNHYANVGTSGGGISILSAQLLNNSDFSTGAFAAEYGNALSGVFDLRLRKGNDRQREYTMQLGLLGADVAMEGPFKKGYEGSYLVNYRYSTLSMLAKVGVPMGDAVTNFQDLSFNVFLPAGKWGNFSMFGFGGLSSQTTRAEKDSLLWKKDSFKRYNSEFFNNTGALGFTNTKLFRNQAYLKTVLAFSGTQNGYYEDKMSADYLLMDRQYEQRYDQTKITLSSTYTRKLNALSNIRTGFILNSLGYNLSQREADQSNLVREKIRVHGATETAQGFFQWNYKLSQKLTANAGLHYFHLLLNNSNSLEPRASLKYDLNNRNVFTMGYGLHSQLQPIGVYFARKPLAGDDYTTPNSSLGLSKAHHLVLGYDRILNEFSHVKTELYYQHLFNVPIGAGNEGTYSMLNAFDGYYTGELVNKGLGRNMGLELTYERFLHKNLYYLLSASLYDSKYLAPNGSWYNTRFNTNYALTFTAGKEWTFTGRGKNRVLGINFKSVLVGGFRYTPIDLEASRAGSETRLKEAQTNAEQNPYYYRLDARISLKRNYRKVTTTVALDLQNATNRRNIGGQYFDQGTGEIKYWYQAPLIPILSYKVEF